MLTRIVPLFLFATASWASTGQIRVNVSNAPGEITLDGMPTDQTAPAIIDAVSPGQHIVELQYGCLKGRAEVVVREGKTVTANLRMRNVGGEGTVRLRGLPPMAKIYVDDAPAGSFSEGIAMSCGGHRVRAEAEGFADWEEMVAVTSDRWTTVNVHMVEVEIEDEPRRARSLDLTIEDDFEETDDLDFLEEDLIARERALEEREARLLQKEKEQQEASRQARSEAARRREAQRRQQEEEDRKSRFGDVDSLDEEGDNTSDSFSDNEDNEDLEPIEEASDEKLDDLEIEEGYQRLDVPRQGFARAEPSTSINMPIIVGLSTTATGLGGLIYGMILHSQYTEHRAEWDRIGQETGSPASNEANEFGQNVLNPAKRKRDTTLGISTALLLGGGSFSAYVFFQPSDSSPNRGTQGRIDREIDDLDRLVPTGDFGLNILVKW